MHTIRLLGFILVVSSYLHYYENAQIAKASG